jgi:hypothetical protein
MTEDENALHRKTRPPLEHIPAKVKSAGWTLVSTPSMSDQLQPP